MKESKLKEANKMISLLKKQLKEEKLKNKTVSIKKPVETFSNTGKVISGVAGVAGLASLGLILKLAKDSGYLDRFTRKPEKTNYT